MPLSLSEAVIFMVFAASMDKAPGLTCYTSEEENHLEEM